MADFEVELEMDTEGVVGDELVSLTPVDPPQARTTRYVVIAAIMAALGGVLFGYDIGVVSGALLQLKQDFNLSCQQQEMVVSMLLVGAVMGALIGGFFIDWIGRRWSIIMNTVIFTVGAVILAEAPSYNVLIVGRLIVGFAVALSAIGECIYISEISPANQRGRLVCVNEIGITMGILLSYLVNYFFISVPSGWRYMFGLSVIPALIQGIGMFCLPPSPRFLMQRGKDSQARAVLQKLRGMEEIEGELGDIRNSLLTERDYKVCDILSTNDNMRGRFLIGVGLVFFQQFTGQTNVLYYAPSIFQSLGLDSDVAATLATVGLGLVKVVSTSICLCCVDKAGRRHFLLVGAGVMTFIIITLGMVAKISIPNDGKRPCISPVTMAMQDPLGNVSLGENSTEAFLTERFITDAPSSIAGALSKRALDKVVEDHFVNTFSAHKSGTVETKISSRNDLNQFQGYPEEMNVNISGLKRPVGLMERGQVAIYSSGETIDSSGNSLPALDQKRNTGPFGTADSETVTSQGRLRFRRDESHVTPDSATKPSVSASSIAGSTSSEVVSTPQTPRPSKTSTAAATTESSSSLSPGNSHSKSSESSVDRTTLTSATDRTSGSNSSRPAVILASRTENKNVAVDLTQRNMTRSETTQTGAAQIVAFLALMLYVGAYSYGFGPVTWLVLSEIFPAGIRGRASSLATVFNWGTNVVVSVTFLDMMNGIGPSWTFLLYGLICTMSFLFIYCIVPETKNRSLEQISAELKKRSHMTGLSGHCCLRKLGDCCICCHGNRHRRLPPSDSAADMQDAVDQAMDLVTLDA